MNNAPKNFNTRVYDSLDDRFEDGVSRTQRNMLFSPALEQGMEGFNIKPDLQMEVRASDDVEALRARIPEGVKGVFTVEKSGSAVEKSNPRELTEQEFQAIRYRVIRSCARANKTAPGPRFDKMSRPRVDVPLRPGERGLKCPDGRYLEEVVAEVVWGNNAELGIIDGTYLPEGNTPSETPQNVFNSFPYRLTKSFPELFEALYGDSDRYELKDGNYRDLDLNSKALGAVVVFEGGNNGIMIKLDRSYQSGKGGHFGSIHHPYFPEVGGVFHFDAFSENRIKRVMILQAKMQ